ncbi:MAG: RIP metalloprotease RseP [Lysobacter sp.]|nr:MAG: RIP metalloprotease RseP [Lysobacter sp.]
MSDFFGSIWWLIVALGVLITFHEFGHYWVARRCGVKVLRFSVGFGKPLWMHRDRRGTEWAIAAIPLGGYVRMLDEREGEVAPEELDQAFTRKTVWQRIAIVAAGPIANFILCIFLFWAMFVIGRPDYAPVVGRVEAAAEASGLRSGDTLLKIGDRETPTWTEAYGALLVAAIDRAPALPIQVRDARGNATERRLDLSRIPAEVPLTDLRKYLGLTPRHGLVPTVIGTVEPGTPGAGVLRVGDRILEIDGGQVRSWQDIAPLTARLGDRVGSTGGDGEIVVERDGRRLALRIAPKRFLDKSERPTPGKAAPWRLGVTAADTSAPPKDAVLRYGPIEAVPAALRETRFQANELFEMFARAFKGRIEVKNAVSGPIGIARAANVYAKNGVAWFLSLLAALSLSLAILNLLPIPVLDGGHLLYYFIELVKGSPLSERAMIAGQYAGVAVLLSLMGLAFYNDLQGLLQ